MTDEPVVEESAAPEPEPEPDASSASEQATWHGVLVQRDSTFSRGQLVAHPTVEQYVDFVKALRDEEGYWLCLDVFGVDYLSFGPRRDLPPGIEPQRFEVVVLLISAGRVGAGGGAERTRVRVRLQVAEDEPVVPTLFDVHPGTEAPEREVFDLYGIRFEGHPDLTRILMPEDWVGHPLRKDYGIGSIPVQFKGISNVR